MGSCEAAYREGAPEESMIGGGADKDVVAACEAVCASVYKPVCGTDGQSLSSSTSQLAFLWHI